MLLRWIPWKYLIGRAARAYGFVDPVQLLARLRGFSQPSEVQEPIELLRAGIIFQARGLVNTRVIQYNLDWVWPFWVEKQYNPADPSFIPRAFSITHINLTQRNWTAVGLPNLPEYPLVDPRGLVTPLFDGWSIDVWLLCSDGSRLLPSRLTHVDQRLGFDPALSVKTSGRAEAMALSTETWVEHDGGRPVVHLRAEADIGRGGIMAVALRPYNPEGISFIEKMEYKNELPGWIVDGKSMVTFDRRPPKVQFSNYDHGDVLHRLNQPAAPAGKIHCRLGLATSAALFPVPEDGREQVLVKIPLSPEAETKPTSGRDWQQTLKNTCKIDVPDESISYLYDAAVRTLVLLSAGEIYPGPYGYRRFWFRDACLMLQAIIALGLTDRARTAIGGFPGKQKRDGYFRSQTGEWDSNGQVLWIMDRYRRLTGEATPPDWIQAAIEGARWILRKRLPEKTGQLHAGLLPPGFSAEHLGPNDYYFWDDFWSVAGLRGAAGLTDADGKSEDSRLFAREADKFEKTIFDIIEKIPGHKSGGGIPASPYRRMDAGAVGSMVADYPLQLTPPKDPRIEKTLDYLMKHSFHNGGFFQDMIHSGVNVYLTLALAQTLLRNEDPRAGDLVRTAADLASPTGQWPEAIHPLTGGGCMGDGQHGWAAAEWVMMIRNLFVREEGSRLVLGSGIFQEWLDDGSSLRFGPTPTCQGPVQIRVEHADGRPAVKIDWAEGKTPGPAQIRVPGYLPAPPDPQGGFRVLSPAGR